MSDVGVFTPYSTVAPLFDVVEDITWVPEEEQERIQSYNTYDQLYWNFDQVFALYMRGTNELPVYIPTPKTVVNETAHYLLKGLTIQAENPTPTGELDLALQNFLRRERFYSRFHTQKHAGVARGDWIMHMTADPELPEGSRISLTGLDPASYFPIYDDDDLDKLLAVRLVEQIAMPDGSTQVKMLQYRYEWIGTPGNLQRIVLREEAIVKADGWWNGKPKDITIKRLMKEEPLDLQNRIQRIPVYHFKNMDWAGDVYGSSELRGHERLMAAINQGASDQEIALALEGLGCFATDAPEPDEGWTIAPGQVLQIPLNSHFDRIAGIRSVAPMLDHLRFLQDSVFEGSSTFRSSAIDVQLAESGIALAIKFMPTLAKIEQRDLEGTDLLRHLFFEWQIWHSIYEGADFTDQIIDLTLGNKLPVNRVQVFNELNNMFDRKLITTQYYREEVARQLGYVFPENMGQQVLDEQRQFKELALEFNPAAEGNRSNNADRTNESNGSEAGEQREESRDGQ